MLRSKRVWIGLLFVGTLSFAWFWYNRGAPVPLTPDNEFELLFGRGSGWHGLDVLRVTSDGKALYEYQVRDGQWECKTFRIGNQELVHLRNSVIALDPWNMRKAYDGGVMDGTQWVLLVRVNGESKSVYFDNSFPDAITRFADFVDQTIISPFADPVAAEAVPAWHQRKYEKTLWDSIR